QIQVVTGAPGINPEARGVSGKMPSLEDSTSLIEAFSREEIQEHVDLLDSGMDLSQERIQQAASGVLINLRNSGD
ncbi:unnamed protein product, partial [Ascophyllum nodosum]